MSCDMTRRSEHSTAAASGAVGRRRSSASPRCPRRTPGLGSSRPSSTSRTLCYPRSAASTSAGCGLRARVPPFHLAYAFLCLCSCLPCWLYQFSVLVSNISPTLSIARGVCPPSLLLCLYYPKKKNLYLTFICVSCLCAGTGGDPRV
jgi:hypothetical protein